MKKYLLLFIIFFCTQISLSQSEKITYVGEGKYKVSIGSGLFSSGLSWVPKKRREITKEIFKFSNSVRAHHKIIDEYAKPTHSGGGTTFGRLDITFVLLDGNTVRLYDSSSLLGGIKYNELTGETEASLTEYYDSKSIDTMEGIYKAAAGEYTIGIKKYNKVFKAIIIKSDYQHWKIGEVKAIFEYTATPGIFSITYYKMDKSEVSSFAAIENTGLLKIPLRGEDEVIFFKMYPVNSNTSSNKINKLKPNEWAGNGSGLIISKSGYIITNQHVIDNANEIEVEFIINGEIKTFNAKVVQTDKVNDLAVIKIFDLKFDGLDNLPYNFKTRSSDVGTKVYAYGYPMALSLMGKEIKITDGIISSKSGFDGDITTYQITAPIQGGNSGGPLFDDKGNFLGINSSGLSKNIADNVGYTIKSSYVFNLIDALPKTIDLPSNTKLQSLPLTEQIKQISKYVVLVKVK